MHSFQVLNIVLFGIAAGFIAFRLYAVLGRRTGNERRPEDKSPIRLDGTRTPKTAPSANENVVAMPERVTLPGAGASAAAPLQRALTDIKLADRNFDTEHFLSGARAAHEMIVTAFAKGDRETLRPLLSDDVYDTFAKAIAGREARKERVDFTFLALKSSRITAAEMKGTMAEVTISFESEIMLAGYDPAGTLIEGDAKTPHHVTDIWTFARETRSSNPNWLLVATASGA